MQQLLAIINIAVAGIVIALSVPLLLDKVPPNRWYGARFQESFTSPERWYQINGHAARLMIAWSCVVAGIGVAALLLPSSGQRTWVVVALAATPLLLAIPAVQSYSYARHLQADAS